MRLFSEKVKPTFTSSDLNILTVKNSEEVFFDVYEFEINGNNFTAEKIANHNSNPVVNIPVVIGEEEFIAPFILKDGEFSVEFNTANKTYIGTTAVDIKEPTVPIVEEDVVVSDVEFPKILEDITFQEGKKCSKMVFDQEVDVLVSDIDHNILVVEDFDEVYFDIFEIIINNKKYNAEKISTYKGRPVVNVPIVFENREYTAPFVLEKGKQEILFNENNLQFVKEVEPDKLQLPIIEEEEVEDIVLEKKEEILQDIVTARRLAKEYAEDIKQKKINEADNVIKANEQRLESYLEVVKEELTSEFLTIIDKTNISLEDNSQSRAKELTKYIEGVVKEESSKLLDNLEALNENSVEHFELKIQELVKNIYTDNLTKLINEKNHSNVSRYSKLFKETKTSLEQLLSENKTDIKSSLDSLKSKIDLDLITLEKSNVDLEDKLERGLNKALSRAGNARALALKEVDDRIKITESKITDVYNVTLSEVNDQLDKRVQDVSHINKQLKHLTKTSDNVSSLSREGIKDVKNDIVKLKLEKELLEEQIAESRSLLDRGIQKLNKLNKNIAKENKIYIKEEVDKLTESTDKSARDTSTKLNEFNKNVTKQLQETKQYIDKEIDSFDSSIDKLKTTNTESTKKSTKRIDTFKKDIVGQLEEAKEYIHKEVQNLDVSIVNLEKANTEINSKLSDSDKAVRKDLFDSIDNTEQILTSLVESKLQDTNKEINTLLTNKLKKVDNKFKEQLTSKIDESKRVLFQEVEGLKKSLPKKLASEQVQFDKLPQKNEKIDVESIKKDIASTISSRFTQEISTIRRYLDSYGGGGGSVAMQFADGGTMRGDLTVQGTISAQNSFQGTGVLEVITKSGLVNGSVIDTFKISEMTAGKYSIQVTNIGSGGGTHFSEISVTTDGTNIGVVEYGINHTTADIFVEYGAIVESNIVSLTAGELASTSMTNFEFKGARLNLF